MAKSYLKNNRSATPGRGSVVINGIRIFNPTEAQLIADGWVLYEPQDYRTVEQRVEESDRKINRETDRKILNEFTWNGEQFYLTMENQFNFKNLYDLRDMREYPVLIKTKNGFMQLDNAAEVAEFYLAGVNFVDQCLKEGWVKKAEAADKIEKEYNAAKNKATETVEE
jgi:hypothetical protein